MPLTDPNKKPKAYDGVIPPKKEDATRRAEKAVQGGEHAVSEFSGMVEAPAPPLQSLDEVDAAIAQDADDVIESVFASVEDLLGDSLHEEDVTATEEAGRPGGEAMKEDASPSGGEGDVDGADATADADGASAAPVETGDDEAALPAMFETSRSDAPVGVPPADQILPESRWPMLCDVVRRFFDGFIAWLYLMCRPRRVIAAVVAVLVILAWPLRLVPEPARPYVDWLALSLVFWIPIIWVIAVFVVGRN